MLKYTIKRMDTMISRIYRRVYVKLSIVIRMRTWYWYQRYCLVRSKTVRVDTIVNIVLRTW
jgi:hypothetical protein